MAIVRELERQLFRGAMIAVRGRTRYCAALGLGLVLACSRPPPPSDGELPAAQITSEQAGAGNAFSEATPARAPEALEDRAAEPGSAQATTSPSASSADEDASSAGEEVVHVVAGDVEPPRRRGSTSLAGDLHLRFREYSFRGPCLVRTVVSRSGVSTNPEWLRPEDCADEVKTALLEQLGRARFEPARLHGEAVAVELHLSIGHCPCYRPVRSDDRLHESIDDR